MKKLSFAGITLTLFLSFTPGTALPREKTPEEIYPKINYAVIIAVHYNQAISINGMPQATFQNIGSGVIIKCKKNKFCVLTANHILLNNPYLKHPSVMPYAEGIYAHFKNGASPQKLKIVRGAGNYDALLLKFSNPKFKPKHYAPIGKSSLLKPGSKVMAIGSNLSGNFWLTSGYLFTKVTPLNHFQKNLLGDSTIKWPKVILMNMPAFKGHSGGPLIDQNGKLIGIIVGFMTIDYQTISIALPIDDLRKEFEHIF